MQTESSALRNQLAQTIDGFLRQLDQAVSVASNHQVEPNEKGRLTALQQPLSSDFEGIARRWREEKLQSLTDTTALHLLELAETLDQRMYRIVNANKPTAPAPAVEAPPTSQSNGTRQRRPAQKASPAPAASKNGNGTKPDRCRGQRLNGGVDNCHPGFSPGTLKHRTLVSFLESHGFEKDCKQTGECVYRHDSGERLSIPPRHSNGEIAKGTTCKVLRRIGKILEGDARLLGGQIVMGRVRV